MKTAIGQAIDTLNSNHGKGSVVAVRLFMSGRGEFDYIIPFSHHGRSAPKTRAFRITQRQNKITVHALKHQITIAA